MAKRVKVAVTGAAGQIGYALLFRIAAGEMFGSDTEIDLSLLELEKAVVEGAGAAIDDQLKEIAEGFGFARKK